MAELLAEGQHQICPDDEKEYVKNAGGELQLMAASTNIGKQHEFANGLTTTTTTTTTTDKELQDDGDNSTGVISSNINDFGCPAASSLEQRRPWPPVHDDDDIKLLDSSGASIARIIQSEINTDSTSRINTSAAEIEVVSTGSQNLEDILIINNNEAGSSSTAATQDVSRISEEDVGGNNSLDARMLPLSASVKTGFGADLKYHHDLTNYPVTDDVQSTTDAVEASTGKTDLIKSSLKTVITSEKLVTDGNRLIMMQTTHEDEKKLPDDVVDEVDARLSTTSAMESEAAVTSSEMLIRPQSALKTTVESGIILISSNGFNDHSNNTDVVIVKDDQSSKKNLIDDDVYSSTLLAEQCNRNYNTVDRAGQLSTQEVIKVKDRSLIPDEYICDSSLIETKNEEELDVNNTKLDETIVVEETTPTTTTTSTLVSTGSNVHELTSEGTNNQEEEELILKESKVVEKLKVSKLDNYKLPIMQEQSIVFTEELYMSNDDSDIRLTTSSTNVITELKSSHLIRDESSKLDDDGNMENRNDNYGKVVTVVHAEACAVVDVEDATQQQLLVVDENYEDVCRIHSEVVTDDKGSASTGHRQETPPIDEVLSKDGDHDSGVDESTQGKDESPKKSAVQKDSTVSQIPGKVGTASATKKNVVSPSTSAASPAKTSKTPSSSSTSSSSKITTVITTSAPTPEKKLPMNKVVVGTTASPNIKVVKSKIGSMGNIKHKPGGGDIKVETKKIDLTSVKSKIGSTDNIQHKPAGGEKKMLTQKLEWKAESKIGSLENATHKAGGGNKKIECLKLEFKDKAKPKVGSKDNIQHKAGGGTIQEIAKSKVGSLDNVTHKPGGGTVQIFDEKTYYKPTTSSSSKKSSLTGSDGHLSNGQSHCSEPSGNTTTSHASFDNNLSSEKSVKSND